MDNNELRYKVDEVPKWPHEWVLYVLQMILAVITATVLIANICGTPVETALIGAGIGTIVYELITEFKSPMFISSCGATCSAVIGALALGSGGNYLYVMIGGLIIFLVYLVFAILVGISGKKVLNYLFPPIIIGPVTILIGLNLATFLPTYIGGDTWAMVVALITMLVTAICSHYFRGFFKSIAFLIGIGAGYFFAWWFTDLGLAQLWTFGTIDSVFSLPEFAFLNISFNDFSVDKLLTLALLFIPVSVCAVLEHISDHNALSNIINVDLTEDPGLGHTLLGDGFASFIGTVFCGLPNTSYGESISCIGFSKVASVVMSSLAAVVLIIMGFLTPVRVVLQSIPSCVFGGSAMILYGYISASGLRTLFNSNPDFNDSKTTIIISVILTIGVSGIFFLDASFTGIALAMVVGLILNLVLYSKKA